MMEREETATDRMQRVTVGVVVPLVVLGLGIGPWVALWPRLPDPMASHFTLAGHADGSIPLRVIALVHVAIAVACAAVLVRAVRRERQSVGATPIAALATFLGLLFGGLALTTALANRGHGDWHGVTLELGSIIGVLGGALGAAAGVTATSQLRWVSAGTPGPGIDLAPDDRVAWFGHSHSGVFAGAGIVLLLGGVASALLGALWPAGATLLFVGVLLGAFSSLDASIGGGGLRVSSGPVHWPRVSIPLDQVETASAIDFKPLSWGGWGYRGSLRMFGRAAWGLRAGPAIELRLTRGRRFAVTVDDAAEGAAVLNGLLARRASGESIV